jgi:translation initiation factor 2B subunit (eIF-2B alpha/beta/delta family)
MGARLRIYSHLPRSSVVEKLLVSAHRAGKRFDVIVVDSRPMLEGTIRL